MLFNDLQSYRSLSGFSGASILLASKDNENYFIRKISRSIEENQRLKVQIQKQIDFKKENINGFNTPSILDVGEIDNKLFYDMEYISGPDAVKYVNTGNYDTICNFSDKLCDYISYAKSKTLPYNANIIENIKNKTTSINHSVSNIILNKLTNLQSNDKETLCHGDFSLENMIIGKDGTIWLLDFLNAPVAHYWQDVSKLYQDLIGGWHQRRNIFLTKCVNSFISNKIYNHMLSVDSNYENFHAILICMNFLRILPYAIKQEDIDLINSRLEYFTKFI